jgi:hypothetical protein
MERLHYSLLLLCLGPAACTINSSSNSTGDGTGGVIADVSGQSGSTTKDAESDPGSSGGGTTGDADTMQGRGGSQVAGGAEGSGAPGSAEDAEARGGSTGGSGEEAIVCPLVNGDAEATELEGWVASGPEIGAVAEQSQQLDTVYPHGGESFFSFAVEASSDATLQQSGTSCLVPGSTLVLSGYVQTEDNTEDDFGAATLNIRDASDSIVASNTTTDLVTEVGVWQSFRVELAVPEVSSSWEVVLSGTLVFGSYVNVFYDSVQLERID